MLPLPSSPQDAISMISDALNLCLVGFENEGITPNPPTPQVLIPHSPEDTLILIQVDTIKYRSLTESRS